MVVDCSLEKKVATAESEYEEHQSDIDAEGDLELVVAADASTTPARAALLIEEAHIQPVTLGM